MPLMESMRVIEAKYAAVVDKCQMRQEKGEIVENNLLLRINPNFFAKNAGAARTPKAGFKIGILAQVSSCTHGAILPQVMLGKQHLVCSQTATATPKGGRCRYCLKKEG